MMNESRAISGFLNKGSAKNLIALTLVNNTSSSQSFELFSAANNFAPNPSTSVNTTTESISLGYSPNGMGYDSLRDRIWVSNSSASGSITIIDCASNTVLSVISVSSVGGFPNTIQYNSLDDTMYVVNFGDATTSVIVYDAATFAQITSIAIATGMQVSAFDYTNNRIYIGSQTTNCYVIDCDTNTLLTTITVGSQTAGMAFDPVNAQIYVSNQSSTSVSVISTASNTVTTTITTDITANPRQIAYDPVNQNMYLCCSTAGTVKVISCATNTVTNTITGITQAFSIEYDSNAQLMYADRLTTGTIVTVISCSTQAITTTITAPAGGRNMRYSSTSYRLYKTNTASSLAVIATGSSVSPTTNSSLTYNQILQDLSANPIKLLGLDMYDLSNNYNQVMQVWGFVVQNPDGTTATEYVYPAVNPGAYQPTKQNLPIPTDFVLDGQNYLTYTLLANQTVMIFVRYNQAIGQQGGEIPQLPADAGFQDTGKKLRFTGFLYNTFGITKLMSLDEILGL